MLSMLLLLYADGLVVVDRLVDYLLVVTLTCWLLVEGDSLDSQVVPLFIDLFAISCSSGASSISASFGFS